MTVTRAEFSNGYANMYDELGRKVRSVACHSLIGYGPKGVSESWLNDCRCWS